MKPRGSDGDISLRVDMDPLLVRLLHRRDAWCLPMAWDVPPCVPEVPLASDRDLQRVRHGHLLAEVWRRATKEHWRTCADIPLVGPVELRALGMTTDGAEAGLSRWLSERLEEFASLSSCGARSDPGWLLWEALACEHDRSVRSVSVLPVMGDWLRVEHGVLQVSLSLYADPERFVDAAMAS